MWVYVTEPEAGRAAVYTAGHGVGGWPRRAGSGNTVAGAAPPGPPPTGQPPRHRGTPAVAAVLLLAMAAGFAAIVAADPAHPPTIGVDRDWFSLLQSTRAVILTDLANGLGIVIGPIGGTVIVIAVAIFLWLVRGRRIAAVFLLVAIAANAAASELIKLLIIQVGPDGAPVAPGTGAFPSGHVIMTLAAGLALAVVLTRPGRRRTALAVVAAATLVMIWCRTYLGFHWLSDTLESVFVTSGLVLAFWAVLGQRVEREAAARPRR